MKPKKARDIVRSVQKAILSGHVIVTCKTKARSQGGKQLVSVGPYRTATSKQRQYTVITGDNNASPTDSSYEAAKEFIEFVGREIAWEATPTEYKRYR